MSTHAKALGMTVEDRIRDAARAEVAANAGPLPAEELSALAAVWLPAKQAARERQLSSAQLAP